MTEPKYKWSTRNPKGPATEPCELVEAARPHRLTGVSVRTLVNGWGAYMDKDRAKWDALLLNAVNAHADLVDAAREALLFLDAPADSPRVTYPVSRANLRDKLAGALKAAGEKVDE